MEQPDSQSAFETEVKGRFGILPTFFRSAMALSGGALARSARSPFARALADLDLMTRMLREMLALPLKRVAAIFSPLQFAAAFAHDREVIALARRSRASVALLFR